MTPIERLLKLLAMRHNGLYSVENWRGGSNIIPKVEFIDDYKPLLETCQVIWGGGVGLNDEYDFKRSDITKARGKYNWHTLGKRAYLFCKDIEPFLDRHDKFKHTYCVGVIQYYESH